MLEFPSSRPVDSHIHVWPDTSVQGLEWLRAAGLETLNSPHSLDAYWAQSRWRPDFVLVESQSTVAELGALRSEYDEHDEIIGIVPFVDLSSADVEYLDVLAGLPMVTTVRDQVQHKGRGYLSSDVAGATLSALEDRSIAFELVITEEQWPETLGALSAQPDQPFVLDHLGNPTGDLTPRGEWATFIRAVAAHPRTMIKISGPVVDRLATGDPGALMALIAMVVEAFGPERVMYGSNWPVSRVNGSLDAQQAGVVSAAGAVLASDELEAFFGRNAIGHYGARD